MKKRFFSLFVCAALLLSIIVPAHMAWADSSSASAYIYTDPDTGATFVVPKDWTETELNEETEDACQAKFVFLNDSGSSILYSSYDLWNDIAPSERSGYTRADINNTQAYESGTIQEMLANVFVRQGFSATIDDVQLVTYGRTEYIELTKSWGESGGVNTLTIIWHIENGYAYTFTFGGASDEAVKNFMAVLYSFRSHAAELADHIEEDSGSDDGNTYTDSETGTIFDIPNGWEQREVPSGSSDTYQMQFVSLKDPGSTLIYSSTDLWSAATASERSGHTRSDFNSDYFYALDDGAAVAYWAERFVQGADEAGSNATVENIELVTYGKNKCIEFSVLQEAFGVRVPLTMVMYVENGYMHIFLFGGNSDRATDDFHSMLSSLQGPAAESSGSGGTGSGQSDEMVETYKRLLINSCLFLLELGVTFLIYALPFVIYRNAIRKRPVNKKVLLIIIIVLYEFVVWVLLNTAMAWFLRSYANFFCAIFWGWYSYRKMVRSKNTDAVPRDESSSAPPQQPMEAAAPFTPAAYIPAVQTPAAPILTAPATSAPVSSAAPVPQTPAAPRIQFCRKCGFRLFDDSRFCSVCGASIVPISNPVSGGELP